MGKGEIARYKQFLLFPQCFQKASFPEASKGVIVWEWVKVKNRMFGLKVGKNSVIICLRLIVFLSLLLVLGGDVEMNPGPVTGQNQRSLFPLRGRGQGSGRNQKNTHSTSRQPTLQANEMGELTVSTRTTEAKGMDLYGLIMSLKSDLNKGMDGIDKSINVINMAINEVSDVCQQLQRENEQLTDNNLKMNKRLERLESELEKADALSRKQNLLIDGYDGSCDETLLTTSCTVRNILRDDFFSSKCR